MPDACWNRDLMSSIASVCAGGREDEDRLARFGDGLSTAACQSAQQQNESRQVGYDRLLHATSKVFLCTPCAEMRHTACAGYYVRRSGTRRVPDTS